MTSVSIEHASSLLHTLLLAGGWRSSDATILEAFPHMSQELYPTELRRTLKNLRIPLSEVRCRENEITQADCPALVLPDDGPVYAVLEHSANGLIVQEVGTTNRRERDASNGFVQVFRIETHHRRSTEKRATSVAETLATLRPMLPWLLVASFLINCLGLLTPLLIMAIYDRVIPTGSVELLVSLAIGVCVILATDFSLRSARSVAMAYVGRNVEHTLSIALFRKFMSLPLQQMQKSAVDQQLSRFRQFEALREVFTGQVMSSLLDLPFALIFLAVLMYIAPQVGVLTLGVVVFFVVLSCVVIPLQQRLDANAAAANEVTRDLLHDAIKHQSTMVNLGLAETWRLRSAPLAEVSERATRRARQFQTSMQSLAQTATALAGLAAIVLSARAALVGDLSFGALIAVIALVSKVIAPLHALHANIPQILVFFRSKTQADRVLALPEEFELGQENSHQKKLCGSIRFTGVTYRPDPLTNPLLNQVSFTSKPGELVVVMGSVSERVALLDLLGGLFTPQVGTIEHDSVDIRQFARDELRQSITLTRQSSAFFYGTVAQNLRLGAPTLTEDEMIEALAHAGLKNGMSDLPDGLGTRLRDDAASVLPDHWLKALSIARGLARCAPIHLFCDPTNGLNSRSRDSFKAWLKQQKGNRTIYIATSDRSLLQLADRFLFLDEGRLVVSDSGDQGLKKIQAALKNFEEQS
jgi:ATP-binding cassette subfamily C protein/ATP-binding cassette subfamily C protein LapB